MYTWTACSKATRCQKRYFIVTNPDLSPSPKSWAKAVAAAHEKYRTRVTGNAHVWLILLLRVDSCPSWRQIKIILLCFQFRNEVDDLSGKFPGMKMSEMVVMICKASNDDGEAVVEQFLESVSENVQKEMISTINRCMPLALAT